jgi:predicted lipoprotein with Yx(FWY)xxD motif
MTSKDRWRRRAAGIALAAVAGLTLVFAACGGDDDDDGDDADNGGEPAATTAAASPTTAAEESPDTGGNTPAAGGDVTISTVTIEEGPGAGTFLVDGDGFTLYIFDSDVAGSGTSACTGGCADAWPPKTVEGASATPTATEDVTGELATITRDDGSVQVTYNGKPLYRFVNDAAPGDANGSTVPGWTIAAP